MEQKNLFSKLLEFIRRFVGTNILWFLFNLPLVILGAMLMKNGNYPELNTPILVMIVLMPFVFFPATSALFGVLRKFIMNENVSIFESFLKHYKDNYMRSMEGGFLFTVAWGLLGYVYVTFSEIGYLFGVISAVLALVLFVFTLNFFAMTVHMEATFSQSLKNVLLISLGGNILSLGVGLIGAAIIYVSFNYAVFLIPLLTGSVIAYIAFFAFYKLMLGIQMLYDKQKKEAEEINEDLVLEEPEEVTESTEVVEDDPVK